MKQVTFALLLTIAVLAAQLPACAQQFKPKTILFVGNNDYTDAELMAAANLKAGIVLTNAEMSEHTKLLLNSGVFDAVSYKFDGLNLTFNLTPAQFMYPIHFSNLPIALTPDLDSELHAKFPLYHGKLPPEGDLVDGVRAAIEEKLAALGIHANILVMPYTEASQHKATAVDFSIVSPPVVNGDVTIDGSSAAFAGKIQEIARRTKSMPFDQHSSASNIQRVLENFYTDQGYAAVKVQVTQAATPVITSTNIQVPFSVKIEEGHPYKLGTIHLAPEIPVTQEELAKAVNLKAGDVAKGANIRSAWQLISNKYKSRGYINCIVTPTASVDESNDTMNYSVSVVPGPVFTFTYVKFVGFSDELRSELTHNWKLMAGDPLDEVYLTSFFARTGGNEILKHAEVRGRQVSYQLNVDTGTHEANVVYKLD